ncbi:hypothetical protein D9M70_589570 [compost metagenome]
MKPAVISTCSGWKGANNAHISNPAMYCNGKVPIGLSVMRFCMIEPNVMLTSANKANSIPARAMPPRPMPW